MIRIGITGPIGCGKSTVAGWLGELGAEVIDADAVAREVTGPGLPATESIATAFGPDLLREDGSLDRAALGRIVFADPIALARLEAIVHPAVRPVIVERIARADASGANAIVIEAIKLVEGRLAELCDEVWLVTCDPVDQLARILARGADRTDAEARIAAQAGLTERLRPAATRVIDTSGPVEATRERVLAAWSEATGAF
jgi:dephospho-CoA kinase